MEMTCRLTRKPWAPGKPGKPARPGAPGTPGSPSRPGSPGSPEYPVVMIHRQKTTRQHVHTVCTHTAELVIRTNVSCTAVFENVNTLLTK